MSKNMGFSDLKTARSSRSHLVMMLFLGSRDMNTGNGTVSPERKVAEFQMCEKRWQVTYDLPAS